MKKIIYQTLLICLAIIPIYSQEEAAPTAKETVKPKYTKNTFQATNIINMQSVEMVGKQNLQFLVAHHFGIIWNKDINAGQNLAQVLGFNSGVAHTNVSLDYSLFDHTNLGIALAGDLGFEGWIKLKLLRQQSRAKNIPVTLAWLSLTNVNVQEDPSNDENPNYTPWNKFSYLHQLLIARKLSPKLSIQLMPTLVHYNIIPYGKNNSNNIFSIGMGSKYQWKQNTALTLEYNRQLNMYENVLDSNGAIANYSPDLLAFGMEFNTGGHVFQFYIGNTTDASGITQLSRNPNFLKDGKFALGFRLNRSFYTGKE